MRSFFHHLFTIFLALVENFTRPCFELGYPTRFFSIARTVTIFISLEFCGFYNFIIELRDKYYGIEF